MRMLHLVFAFFSAAILCASLHADADPAPSDEIALQGMWELKDQTPKRTLEIKGRTFTFRSDESITRLVTARFDETKKPKALDLKEDGEPAPFLAIYKLDGEHLTLCIGVEAARPTNKRPTTFEAKQGQVLTTYSKIKR